MAKIIDMGSSATTVAEDNARAKTVVGSRAPKVGRKSRFTLQEDLIIAQEVGAAEANLAPHGETQTRFEKAAEKAKENPNFAAHVSGINVQDRFKKLLDDFASRDDKDRNLSGVGGEIGELDDLLSDMLEARRDRDAKKDGDAKDRVEQEEKKLAAGNAMVLNALRGKDRKKKDSSDEETPAKKRRLEVGDGMAEIGLALRETEASRFEVERERSQFDWERLEKDNEQKAAERKERAQEREQREKEVSSYRSGMERTMEENAKHMQAMMGMMTAPINRDSSNKRTINRLPT